mgnify:CR=1 FL=1
MKMFALILIGLLSSFSLFAEVPYTKEAFTKSQEKNEKIMLQVHAGWCPVCKSEDKVFGKLKQEDYFKKVTYYQADYDKEATLKKEMNVISPGTLILFEGKKEVARIPGIQSEEDFKRFAGKFFE